MPAFDRMIGIDYSGAETATSGLTGLRVYMGTPASPPAEVLPPPGASIPPGRNTARLRNPAIHLTPRKHWTRRGVAEWLAERLLDNARTLVGIDHGFSFPLLYFEAHRLPHDWPAFLDDFQHHWPTDADHTYVDFVRDGLRGNAAARSGNARWRRLTEIRAGAAKSVFHFDVPGSVAKSTHAGLPWLRHLRRRVGERIHFWPFDGWSIPAGRSVVAEVYPSLVRQGFPRESRTPDQHDAYSVAAWLRRADQDGTLAALFEPSLTTAEREVAQIEGWILGVM